MMKTINATMFATLCTVSFGFAVKEFVSIDSLLIMQKSKEGQELTKVIQDEITQFQGDIQKTQKLLADEQESLTKKSKILSVEALQEKNEQLGAKRKKMEREFADKEEALRLGIQRRQVALRERQLNVVSEIFEKESWAAVIDKNTPGLLCVSSAIDKTDDILKAVDARYTVKPKIVQTVAKNTTEKNVKTDIKTA